MEKMTEKLTVDGIRSVLAERGFTDYAFVKREFKYLTQVLNQDEHPLAAVSGLMNGNSILCLLTNRQLWFVDHGLVYGIKSSTIPLMKVNAISYQRHLVFADIEITNGADVTMIRNVGRKSAQKFVKVVNDYLMKFREQRESSVAPKSSSQLDGLAGQLTSLKQLLDSGALSKEEFQAAKGRLLGMKSGSDDGSIKPRRPKDNDDDNNQDLGGHGIGL